MVILFIHQNFPGQYKHLVRHFADKPDWRVLFLTQSRTNAMSGVERIVYDPALPQTLDCHPFTVDFDRAVRIGLAVADACRKLKADGLRPDIICGHNGWGEMLFVKDVFPDAPILSYFEFYYHAQGVDVDFDPEFASGLIDPLRLRTRNAVNLLGFDAADWGNTPTLWQRAVHPPELRSRLTVLHEGVDTQALRPDPSAWLLLQREGVRLGWGDEVVTYVARNLEPYRGFHTFMRASAEILRRRPRAHIVVVGGDDVSYGNPPASGLSHRETMLQELGSRLDLSRLHFLGKIAYDAYVKLLQISAVHVYLTYPFVLSWSFLEAMACGCAVIGSDTPPVMEVLRDRENGLAVDFFNPIAIADKVDALLDDRSGAASLRRAARDTAVQAFDLKSRQLPLWERLIEDLLERRRPALTPGAPDAVPEPQARQA
jgi:glycosyltransferase involved in cell wall biosynthesis